MILEFDKSFEKSLDKIKDKNILNRIENVLVKIDNGTIRLIIIAHRKDIYKKFP